MSSIGEVTLDEITRAGVVSDNEFMHSIEDFEPWYDYICHVGVAHDEDPPGRGSGRWAYGSGARPHQHEWDMKARIEKMEKAIDPDTGKRLYSDSQIAAAMGCYAKDFYGNTKYDEDGNPVGSPKMLHALNMNLSNIEKKDKGEIIADYKAHINPATGKVYTDSDIARIVYGDPKKESSIRSAWTTYLKGNIDKATQVADALEKRVKESGYIDVTGGTETNFNDPNGLHDVSQQRLETALYMLEARGYSVQKIQFEQPLGKNKTTMMVLGPEGMTQGDAFKHRFEVETIDGVGGIHNKAVIDGIAPPKAIDLNRVNIVYAENGGTERDGLIQIKAVHKDPNDPNSPLVAASPDLSLGNARFGQIRIAVDGGPECITDKNPTGMKYIKGMAVYSDDPSLFPDGSDICVNSNKSIEKGPKKALKDLGDVMAPNPFGASVVPTEYIDANGKPQQSAINFVGSNVDDMHVEGSWSKWNKNLPSQFLAKQPLGLIEKQLSSKLATSKSQLQEIEALTNPTVKKKLLQDFADQCDANAASLKAAPIAGQSVKVLLPIPSLDDDHCYCPSMENGQTVAMVRFPHEGPWEIKIATVDNGNKEGRKMFGDGQDAIGINQRSAGILSGADFDGDTCIVIPVTKPHKDADGNTTGFDKANDISTWGTQGEDVRKLMNGFDPTESYSTDNPRFAHMVDKKGNPTFHVETEQEKQMNMGICANLMTDAVQAMKEAGADPKELAYMTKFNQVVIDGHKHELNVDAAYEDFHIAELHKKYQGKVQGGASTILSRAKSPLEVNERRPFNGMLNPKTGNRVIDGKDVITGEEVKDAHKCSNGIDTVTGELVYADTGRKEKKNEKIKVPAPEGYVWKNPETGKLSKNLKYMKDPNGKDVYETRDGKIFKDEDGFYQYSIGTLREDGTPNYKWQKGKEVNKTIRIKKMDSVKDARELMNQDHPSEVEKVYAEYANSQKALANQARKEIFTAGKTTKSKDPAIKEKYAPEVESLNQKLLEANKHRQLERQAVLCATQMVNAWYKDNPNASKDKVKKYKSQAMKAARDSLGGKSPKITFTDKEWEAINNGAVSESTLSRLLQKADKDNYTKLATPKAMRLSDSTIANIRRYYSEGLSPSLIQQRYGYSLSSIEKVIQGKNIHGDFDESDDDQTD